MSYISNWDLEEVVRHNFKTEVISEYYNNWRDAVCDDLSGIESIKGLPVQFIDNYRSADGDHDTRYLVFQVGDQYFRISGLYSSWDSTQWYPFSIEEVKPIEKLVTIYEPISNN